MAEQNYNKLVAQILGAVLVLVGLLGFVLNPTLIVFGVNTLHNIVHLLTGAILLAGAFIDNGRNARLVNIVLGAVYVLVALVGFVAADFMGDLVNSRFDKFPYADAILHALLGIVLLGVAFAMRQEAGMTSKM